MTVKQRLREYRDLCQYIQRLEEKVEYFRIQANFASPKPIDGVKVKTMPKQDPMGDLAAKYMDEMQLLVDKLEKRKEERRTVLSLIEPLTPREKNLIELYYEEGKDWHTVAGIMNYTVQRIYQLHGEILQKMEAYYSYVENNRN
jgi:RNA polymerase sigma factor (sigma-70 family)